MAKNYGKKPEELQDNENLKNYIKQGIENEKALDFLIENSKTKKASSKKDETKSKQQKHKAALY